MPALFPRTHAWKITLFAARGLLMSTQNCLVFVLGFQSWRVDSQGDKSKLRSIEVKVRGRYRPRGRITKSVTVTTAYNRTILSGTAASAQYKMAKAALHLNACNLGYGGQRTRISHRCHGKHGEHRKNCASGTVIE